MTVSTIDNKVSYDCDGAVTEFPFTFKIISENDLIIYLTDNDTGDETQLELTTDYSVSQSGGSFENGGIVTMNSVYPVGKILTIYREVSMTQETDYTNNSTLPGERIETDFDKLVMMIQQLGEKVGRSLLFNILDQGTNKYLPSSTGRANKYFAFDENGAPMVADGASGVPVSTYMANLLAAADANAARTALDVQQLTVETILASLTSTAPQKGLFVQEVDGVMELFYDSNEPDTTPDPVQLTTGGMLNLDAVLLTGNQTINGIKTFLSSPVVPTPTASTHAANKGYVGNAIANSVGDGTMDPLSYTGQESVKLSNKYIMKSGKLGIPGNSSVNVVFDTPFPNGVKVITVTYCQTLSGFNNGKMSYSNETVNGFTANLSGGATDNSFSWTAIGW